MVRMRYKRKFVVGKDITIIKSLWYLLSVYYESKMKKEDLKSVESWQNSNSTTS